jgi:uncharacterized membrane protein YbhN (UPF0104 family)
VALGVGAYLVAVGFLGEQARLPDFDLTVWLSLVGSLLAHTAAIAAFGLNFIEAASLSGIAVSRWGGFKAALVATGVARLIPAGGIFTPAAMAWTVRSEAPRTGGPAARATVLAYGSLLIVSGVGALWAAMLGLETTLTVSMVVLGIVLVLIGALVWAGSGRLASLAGLLPQGVRRRVSATLIDRPVTLVEVMTVLARTGFEVLALGLVLRPIGIDLPIPALLAAYGFSQLVGGLPGPPGGIGLVEAGMVGALAAFGVDPQTSLPAILVYRLVSYWIPAAAGLLAGGAAFVRAGKPTPTEVATSPPDELETADVKR